MTSIPWNDEEDALVVNRGTRPWGEVAAEVAALRGTPVSAEMVRSRARRIRSKRKIRWLLMVEFE